MDTRARDRLRALFLDEFDELVGELSRGLVTLEAEADGAGQQGLVADLFRHAHTLKGAARSAGAARVASLCHGLEERLDELRRAPQGLDPATVGSLFELLDAIHAAGADRRGEAAPPEAPGARDAVSAPPSGRPHESSRRPAEGSAHTLRVPAGKLDALLRQAHEVVTAEESLEELLGAGQPLVPEQVRPAGRRLRRAGAGLQTSLRALRMAPFGEACNGLERLARDVAAAGGKEVRTEVRGAGVELGRSVLDALREPLAHLVRNAVDHGIETPARRRAAGKPTHGRVTVQAVLQGGRVQVELRDDGAGIDLAAVRSAAQAAGREITSGQELAALFTSGLSTASDVSETSGRGVGLDAVQRAVEALGGAVDLTSSPGRGTAVRMVLPLTLSSLRVVVIDAGGRLFALASSAIDRLARVDPEEIGIVEGRQRLLTERGPLPLVPLAGVLGLPDVGQPGERFPVVLASTGGQQVALRVDAFVRELEVTVNGLGERLAGVPAALGGCLLPDGRPVLVISPTACARLALAAAQPPLLRPPAAPTRPRRVLLVEDSPTTRMLERSILEAAGFAVTAAADGRQALELAGQQRFDAIVSDVAMPLMDGITLCARIRSSARHADVPVVLVTSRVNQDDRLRGLEAGANAYLTKQSFDQGELLDTIGQLAGEP